MRTIVLVSLGTCGDVFPFIAIGKELLARGHSVWLASNEQHRAIAEEQGLTFFPLATQEEADSLLLHPDLFRPRKSALLAFRWMAAHLEAQFGRLKNLALKLDPVLIASPIVPAARLVQEVVGVPRATICYVPLSIPSAIHPPRMMSGIQPPKQAPRILHRAYWKLVDSLIRLGVRSPLRRIRKAHQLPDLKSFFAWMFEDTAILATFPDWFAPTQSDWPPEVTHVGFPWFDGAPNPPWMDEVAAFLEAGSPPVIMTLGTGITTTKRIHATFIEWCVASHRRGLILTRQRCDLPRELPMGLATFPFVPHGLLLPKALAILHHGGMGTTAQAMRAGIPQIVLPHAWDQLDNGIRVSNLGIGHCLAKPRTWQAERFETTLRSLLSEGVAERCSSIRELCLTQYPHEIAAEVIESHESKSPGSIRC